MRADPVGKRTRCNCTDRAPSGYVGHVGEHQAARAPELRFKLVLHAKNPGDEVSFAAPD